MYKKSQYQQITAKNNNNSNSYTSNNTNFLNINILSQSSHKKYLSKQTQFYQQELNNVQNIQKSNLLYPRQNSSYKKVRSNTLQDLLQKSQKSLNYGYVQSNQSIKKKLIFNQQLSFLSRDHTNDLTNQQNYQQFMNKIHFQKSRNRQLTQTFINLKNQMTKKYLSLIMEQFKNLSQDNKVLRQQYKKIGGEKRKKENCNQSMILTNNINVLNTGIQTPRNIKARRSLAAGSVIGDRSFIVNNNVNHVKNQFFKTTAFVQHTKANMLRQSNKPFYCQSSTNIQCESNNFIKPSPHTHKRRQSQLTQRKDYPNQNDYLMIFDNQSQMQIDQNQGRFSQPNKMQKKNQFPSNQIQNKRNNFNHWANQDKKSQSNRSRNSHLIRNSSQQINEQDQYFYQPNNNKNIFIEFLQQILIQQKVKQKQFISQVDENISQLQANEISYNNIKHIETLQKQIMQKNMKLKQLQQVIHIYKDEIQQIMGTDIKQINQIMLSLLEVKGKYLQMQEKVNGLNQLKQKVKAKQQIKEQVMNKIQEKIEKQKKKQLIQGKQINYKQDQQLFIIPQSIKILLEVLDVKMKKNSKPGDYLNQIKLLSKNKQIFNAFNSSKKKQSHAKISQIISSIQQGRKKFNQIIKIYQGRISKLQQKIQKYKTYMQGSQQKNSQKKNN